MNRITVEQIGGTDTLLTEAGASVGSTVAQVTENPASGYAAQVNDRPADAGQVLNDGDRLSIVPTQVKGACA